MDIIEDIFGPSESVIRNRKKCWSFKSYDTRKHAKINASELASLRTAIELAKRHFKTNMRALKSLNHKLWLMIDSKTMTAWKLILKQSFCPKVLPPVPGLMWL